MGSLLRIGPGMSEVRQVTAIPDSYVDVLTQLSVDPNLRSEVRDALNRLGDDALTNLVVPMPSSWRSNDYALFASDRRVQTAELARRISKAVTEWSERSSGFSLFDESGVEIRDVEEWTREQFSRELGAWRQANPDAYYEP